MVKAGSSLRAKAMIAFAAFAVYLAATGAAVSWQRAKVTGIVVDLEEVHQIESTLARVNTVSAHVMLRINESAGATDLRPVVDFMGHEIESIVAGLGGLRTWYPRSGSMMTSLESALAAARADPGRPAVLEVLAAMRTLVTDLSQLAREVRGREAALWSAYRSTYDSVTLIATSLFVLGLLVFGGVALYFVTRLSWDLRTLATRSVDIVRGYRGSPLAVTRADEVGALMDAVNRMQHILREREREIEVVRQQRFHQEKMVAIGSLAAAVAHEINNPIAAIEGVAQSIHAVRAEGHCPIAVQCMPELILEHTRRIVGITRQLSEMSSPASRESEWTDLNALVRTTTTFVSYDPRFRAVRMELALDASIPAAWVVADHVTQVLMNLLINAADALGAARAGERRIDIATAAAEGDFVRLAIRDNGPGMLREVAARAFEEGFTTKSNGSGIGLFMCKTLVEKGHGRIALASEAGAGTTVSILLPCNGPKPAAAH